MRKIQANKEGKMNNTLVWLAVTVGVVFLIYSSGLLSNLGTNGDSTDPTSCAVATTLDLKTVDAINKGTAVVPTINAKVNGGAKQTITSSTNLNPGDRLDIHLNASNFIDENIDSITLKCGVNSASAELYATDASSISVFNEDGQKVTKDILGGATNQSASSTPINMEVKITSNSDQSSGDLVVVVEATNTTQVDDLVISGAESVSVPEFYTVSAAGAIAKAYRVPALIDGDSKTYNLKITPESGQTIDGTGIYLTAYSEQAYADTDGSFKVGVENSDGTAVYEDTFNYNWLIT